MITSSAAVGLARANVSEEEQVRRIEEVRRTGVRGAAAKRAIKTGAAAIVVPKLRKREIVEAVAKSLEGDNPRAAALLRWSLGDDSGLRKFPDLLGPVATKQADVPKATAKEADKPKKADAPKKAA